MESFGIVIISGILSLVVALFLAMAVMKKSPGNSLMIKISTAIQKGASAFLIEEYKTMAVWVLVFAVVIGFIISWYVALSFVIGTILSVTAGFLGMTIATRANGRTAHAARSSMGDALRIAFSGGSVMGLTVTGLGILGSVLIYLFSLRFLSSVVSPLIVVVGYSMGASFVALFARVGGGIYTKAADVGADLVGKVEAGIPEDDPRNPAVIADNVGDNVGDVAGMGADLYESYVGSILSGMILGSLAFGINGIKFVYLIAGYGIFSSLIGVLFVLATSRGKINPQRALNSGTLVANIIAVLFAFYLSSSCSQYYCCTVCFLSFQDCASKHWRFYCRVYRACCWPCHWFCYPILYKREAGQSYCQSFFRRRCSYDNSFGNGSRLAKHFLSAYFHCSWSCRFLFGCRHFWNCPCRNRHADYAGNKLKC